VVVEFIRVTDCDKTPYEDVCVDTHVCEGGSHKYDRCDDTTTTKTRVDVLGECFLNTETTDYPSMMLATVAAAAASVVGACQMLQMDRDEQPRRRRY
jgi:hypothetical protein